MSEISAEEVSKPLAEPEACADYYSDPGLRLILESRAYYWCRNFAKQQPYTMRTYYEDDAFVCYYFRQNPYSPYNLSVEGWDGLANRQN